MVVLPGVGSMTSNNNGKMGSTATGTWLERYLNVLILNSDNLPLPARALTKRSQPNARQTPTQTPA